MSPAPEHTEPTPHVCQFCGTPLRDHWWDPCTYTAPTGPEPRTDAAHEIQLPPLLAAYQRAQRIIADWTNEDWADYADLARRFAHALVESCDTCRHHDPRTDAAVER